MEYKAYDFLADSLLIDAEFDAFEDELMLTDASNISEAFSDMQTSDEGK